MGKVPISPRRPGAAVQRLILGAGTGILIGLTGHTSTYAFDDRVVDGIEHFIACKILLLAEPDEHARQCLPNQVPPSFGTLVTQVPGSAEPICEGNLDGDHCYSEACDQEQLQDPFYVCSNQPA